MSEPTNEQRAAWAMAACKTFAQHTGQDTDADELESVIGDLIADLLHLADQHGVDAERVHRVGLGHYTFENGGGWA